MLLLTADARDELGDLRLDLRALVVDALPGLRGDLQLARVNAELDVRRLQLLLGVARLAVHLGQAIFQPGDFTADAIEIGVTGGRSLGEQRQGDEQKEDEVERRPTSAAIAARGR